MIKLALVSGKTADDSFSSNCTNLILVIYFVILFCVSGKESFMTSVTMYCVNGYSKISYSFWNLENILI